MVLRVVQRREVGPVVLDLRAVGDREADRAEDLLDAAPGAADRVQAAAAAAAARQRDVERLLGQARLELRVRQGAAALLERGFDAVLGGVDRLASGLALLGREPAERLQQPGEFARLAEEARLGVLERRGVARGGELGAGARDDFVGIIQCARLALIWPAILANAGLSVTARSARTLRSISICAFFMPDMNAL